MFDRVQISSSLKRLLFWGFAAGAFAAYLVLVVGMRPMIWKLADQTFCLADWEGFREAALPGLYPGGVLRWLAALLMSTGLVDGVWWIPYVALPLAFAWKGRVSPFLLTAASLLHLGTRVWQLPDYAFPMTNLLGMGVVIGFFVALRPLARKGWWSLAAVGLCAVAFIPLGMYAVFAGVLLAVDSLIRMRARLPLVVGCALLPLVLLVSVPWLASTFVYDDVALDLLVGYSQSVLNGALLEPFGFWPILAFLLLGVELLLPKRRVHVSMAAALCGLMFLGLPKDDVRPQFRMERCMMEGRYADALKEDAREDRPLRMSIAYRVYALWRTNRLENDLFVRPFSSFHRSTVAEELRMDGQNLLFAYGFLQPARQQAMESAAAKGWQAGHLRLLGDVAYLTGEPMLAIRYWRQMARCPFRGEFAQRRLRGLYEGKGLDDSAFEDLRAVAMLHAVWQETVRIREEPPFYHFPDRNVEAFVYGRLLTIKGNPSPEVARLALAAYLLEKDAKALVGSRGVMDVLCPEGPWPRVWQQGVLSYLGKCSEDERTRLVASLREGVFTQDEVDRFDRFVADIQNAASQAVDFSTRYGDTYYFYEMFVQ